MGLAEVHSIALFHLTREADIVFDQAGNLFDSYAYSRFKYGSRTMARQYAHDLHALLHQKHPELWQLPTFWLTSSAYKAVPTASDGLAQHLWTLMQASGAHVGKVKIARDRLFPADYGNLSLAERQAIMHQVAMFFETTAPKPETLLIIDDIRITGAHESRLLEFAEREGFQKVIFAYIAHLSPKAEPTTEHWLNHTAVRDLRDVWDLWREEGCLLNARICKFLLSYPNSSALRRFAKALPTRLRERIAAGMWGDGYAQMEMYASNWEVWKDYHIAGNCQSKTNKAAPKAMR